MVRSCACINYAHERRNGYERGLAQCTRAWVALALRKSSFTLTPTRADTEHHSSANPGTFCCPHRREPPSKKKQETPVVQIGSPLATILFTGISGIFVNNLPLSFSATLARSSKPPNAKIPGLFRYFGGARTSGIFENNPPPKTLRSSLIRPHHWQQFHHFGTALVTEATQGGGNAAQGPSPQHPEWG